MPTSGHLSYVTRRDEKGQPLPPQGRRKVFISYRKRDNRATGIRDIVIDKILGIVDCAVWYDDGGLTPGLDYRQEIIDAITECDAMVLLLTKDILQSDFVWEIEVPTATSQQKGIIPIALDISTEDYAEVEKKLGKNNIQILRWSSGSEGIHGISDGADFDDALKRAISTFVINADLRLRVRQFFASGAHNTSISHLTPEHRYLMGVGYLRGIGTDKDIEEGVSLLDSVTLIPCDDDDNETKKLKADAANAMVYGLFGSKRAQHLTEQRIDRFADIAVAVSDNDLLYRLAHHVYRDTDTKSKALPLYTKAAELGHDSAMFTLGLMYANGDGVEKNIPTAISWYEKSLELGNSGSMNNLGAMYSDGIVVQRDTARAFELFTRAAELGNATAMCNLAGMYLRGTAGIQDTDKAFELYSNAAMLGEMTARENLANMYNNGIGTALDREKAFDLYQKVADQGSISAMLSLASMYLEGKVTAKNPAKAIEWNTIAAQRGDISALLNLGDLYSDKKHIARDRKKAREYYRRALTICRAGAKTGDAFHLYTLGHMYSKGQGVAKNLRKAFRYFRKAADAGNIAAVYRMAYACYRGEGVGKNRKKALALCERGDSLGSLDCTYLAGLIYLYGKGVRKDYQKAAKYLEKCANNGNVDAMYWLGVLYTRGKRGMEQNMAIAYKLYSEAAARGHVQSTKMKRICERFDLISE